MEIFAHSCCGNNCHEWALTAKYIEDTLQLNLALVYMWTDTKEPQVPGIHNSRVHRRYFTVKFSAYRQAPGSHRYYGAISTMEPQVSWNHKYHRAMSITEPHVPWSHTTMEP